MREDLLGYLLGALEPDEERRVERLLQRDPVARQELARIEASLKVFDHDETAFTPPDDLIAKTMDFIDASRADRASTPSAMLMEPLRNGELERRPASNRRWRIPDALVAVVSMIVLAGLVFPAMLQQRFEARRSHCQQNLQELGTSLAHFAINDPQRQLPNIDLEGPLAFAGVFMVKLKEAELLDRENSIWCPSQDQPETYVAIPSISELQSASLSKLTRLQAVSGGHLAYSLGVMDGEEYRSPRYEARSTFAILGDAPIRGLNGAQWAHEGRGYNLLYEDGRVRFVSNDVPLQLYDHPFVNLENRAEAGLNINDASLGERPPAPFVWVRQSL
ncbi:MAG: hypothetical protein R3C05_16195 [Pirellulaceae bacterium]